MNGSEQYGPRAAEPEEDGAEVMSAEMLSDAVMVASSILAAQTAGSPAEPRSVKLAGALAQLSGPRTTIVVRARRGRCLALPRSWRCMPLLGHGRSVNIMSGSATIWRSTAHANDLSLTPPRPQDAQAGLVRS